MKKKTFRSIYMSNKLWFKQPEETSRQYAAFCLYRDMGPSRSIQKVAQKRTGGGPHTSRLKEWSNKYQWVNRAIAYDEHIDQIIIVSQEEELKKMVARHTREAELFQSKVHERLENIDPDELKPHELIKWYETAVKIERISRGVPEKIIREETKEVNEDVITKKRLRDPQIRKRDANFIKAIADSQSSTDRISIDSQ
jgi:hypothetical protein